MKIVVVGFRFNCPTGRRNLAVYQELCKNHPDVQVKILTVDRYGAWNDPYIDFLEIPNLKIVKLPSLFTKQGQFKYVMPTLFTDLLKEEFDVLYCQEDPNTNIAMICTWASKIKKKPMVLFWWENIYKKWWFPISWVEKEAIKQSFRLIAGTEDVKKLLVTKGSNPDKIRVFPETGENPELFKPSDKPRKKKILFVGRFLEEKGMETIKKAKEIIEKKGFVYEWEFVGDGPMKSFLEDIPGKVTVLPWKNLDELPEIYSSAKVMIYPSQFTSKWKEQFGFSIVESLMCETPVIATNTSGPESIIVPGKMGFLIGQKDENELAQKIMMVMEMEGMSERMGKAGREHMIKSFSNQVISEKLYEVFQECMTKYY